MKKLKVYEYAKCSTCKKALQFLERSRVEYESIPIVDTPPSQAELKKMLQYMGGNIKKLFNTSGILYREMKLGEKMEALSQDDAIRLLAQYGKLVKRPFAIAEGKGIVGFNEAEWKKFIAS